MKTWYASKTLWFNGVTVIVAIATWMGWTPDQSLFDAITTALTALAPLVNIFLRFYTDKAIGSVPAAPAA